MGNTIGEILAAICIELLKYLQDRADLKEATRDKLALQAGAYANQALSYKIRALGTPDGGGTLRVQPHAGTLALSGPASRAARRSLDD